MQGIHDYKREKGIVLWGTILLCIACLFGCASKKNTASSRFFHSFNARYNTYFNGTEAFRQGYETQEKGNVDNYMEMIPLYAVSNTNTQKLGSTFYNKAIEKAEKAIKRHSIKKKPEWTKNRKKNAKEKAYFSRREFNPFIYKAWLLLGKSQFYKGEFNEAAATFSYMERLYVEQPDQIALARIWKARCYTELGWLYEAEDAIRNMMRDSISTRLQGELAATLANYSIASHQEKEAISWLKKAIRKEKRHSQKIREYYLLGQLLQNAGQKQEACKAFKKVVAKNPPYETAFNARMRMAETASGQTTKSLVKQLTTMARSEKNKDFLDQIYYAIGNVYLNKKDTAKAIANYEKGIEKSVKAGIPKSILAIHLAQIYWDKWDYINAARCYTMALGLIDKENALYNEIKERSESLSELSPHLKQVNLQDSLQQLAAMPEAERLNIIDKIIENVKKEEARAKHEAEQQQLSGSHDAQVQLPSANSANRTQPGTASQANNGSWYFYTPNIVQNGKSEFERQWGGRKLEDNWRRANKTVVAFDSETKDDDEAIADTTLLDDTLASSTDISKDGEKRHAMANDTISDAKDNGNKSREFYLKDIPLTDEAMAKSNAKLADALFASATILKDKVENFIMARQMFDRLQRLAPDYDKTDIVLYSCFQMELRNGNRANADDIRSRMLSSFPDSKFTKTICAPDFERDAVFGKQIEDSLYTEAYERFKEGEYNKVLTLCEISEQKYPDGANRPRFMFIKAISLLQTDRQKEFSETMRELTQKYQDTDIATLAGFTVKGIQEGRTVRKSSMQASNIWNLRLDEAGTLSDSAAVDTGFVFEPVTPFAFVIAFEKGNINEGQLLYDVARYNFSNFMVRNFDIRTDEIGIVKEIIISGFQSYDEVTEYRKRLFGNKEMVIALKDVKSLIISEDNLAKIGKQLSFADYENFYTDKFTTLSPQSIEIDDTEPTIIDEDEVEDDGEEEN